MRGRRVLVQVVAALTVLTGAATSPALAAAQAGASATAAPSAPAGTAAQVAAADPVWSAPVTAIPDRGEPSDVSCPTTTWCMAVDLSGQALTFNGHSWSAPR